MAVIATLVVLAILVTAALLISRRHHHSGAACCTVVHQQFATLGYPTGWKSVTPDQQNRVIFAAVGPTTRAGNHQGETIRRAGATTGDYTKDIRLFNDLQGLEHPGRRVITQRDISVSGAQKATLIVAEYASNNETLRQADIIVRTSTSVSYHLVEVGTPSDLSIDDIDATARDLQVLS